MKRRGLNAELIVMQKKRNDERRRREEERRRRKFAELSQQSFDGDDDNKNDNNQQQVSYIAKETQNTPNSVTRNIMDDNVDVVKKIAAEKSQQSLSTKVKKSSSQEELNLSTKLPSTLLPVQNVGSFIHKTSPDSSVSMSQQTPSKNNNNNNNNYTPTLFGKQSNRQRSLFTTSDDDNSSDDEDDDLLAQALMLDKKKKQKLDEEKEKQRRVEEERKAKEQQQEEERRLKILNENDEPKNSLHNQQSQRSDLYKNHSKDDSEDSDDDDDYLTKMARALDEKRKQQEPQTVMLSKKEQDVDTKSKAQEETLKTFMPLEEVKKARNPIQWMRKFDAAVTAAAAVVKENSSNSNNNNTNVIPSKVDDAALWSDSDNDDDAKSHSTNKSNKSKSPSPRKKKIKKHDDNDNENKKRRNPKNRQQQQQHDAENTEPSEQELERLQHELKPNFTNPKFGPFPDTEPLVLGDNKYQVPNSIARYLPDYQRKGIQFLYDKAVARQLGAILGDDMGLGKTVQTIALLSALFKKTGTGRDQLDLSRRKHRLEAKANQIEEEKEKALLNGHMLMDNRQELISLRDELHSEWAPVLIICPNSVVVNWERDFETWAHFGVAIYIGSTREEALESIENGIAEVLVCAQSMIQSKKDFETLNNAQVRWKLVVIDEFHKVKNEKTMMAINIKKMRDQHKSVLIGLTGTLMQNDHKELWTLVDICVKGFLGEWKSFQVEYAKPIKLARTVESNLQTRNLGLEKSYEISNMMKEIYLRRTKEEVLAGSLPQKDERIIFCEPSPLQKELYRFILELPDFDVLSKSHCPCDCGVNQKFFLEYQHLQTKEEKIQYQRKYRKSIMERHECCYKIPKIEGSGGELDPKAILFRQHHEEKEPGECEGPYCPYCILLPALNILLKLSSHVSLLQAEEPPEQFEAGSKKRKEAENILERAQTFIPEHLVSHLPGGYIRNNSIMDNHFSLSGKMIVLDKLLRAISKQQGRVLLFSYSTKMLDLIQNFIESQGFSYLRMDGQTSQKKREAIADQFRSRPDVLIFLLSTKAMGLGLNLTEANFVIIFDAEWNPANDDQAQDRAYRIGQTKDVKVFRLVSRGTVEELKYLRQVYKTQLKNETFIDVDDPNKRDRGKRYFRGVAGDINRKGELFGLENLLKFKDGSFMNYASSASESRQFGVGVHDTEKVMEEVNGLNEDDFDEICADGNVFDNLALRKERENENDTTGNDNDFCEEEYLGGMSQAVIGVCDRIRVPEPEIDTSLECQESPSKSLEEISEYSSPPQQSTPSRSALPTAAAYAAMETQSPVSAVTKLTHKNSDQNDALLSRKDGNDRNETKPHNGVMQKSHHGNPLDRENVASLTNQQEQQEHRQKQESVKKPRKPKKSSLRNTRLVGQTTNNIRLRGDKNTTFSLLDIPLPGNRKKKS